MNLIPNDNNLFIMHLSKFETCLLCGNTFQSLTKKYLFDIPIIAILQLTRKTSVVDMSKTSKIRSSSKETSLNDLKDNLFPFFKQYISNCIMDCNCNSNKISTCSKTFTIEGKPLYIMLSLSYNIEKEKEDYLNKTDLLRIFILIPKLFELGSLFEHQSSVKIFYEIQGLICIKNGYQSVTILKHGKIWTYYEDEIVFTFVSFHEMVQFSLNNGIVPYGITYCKLDDKYNDSEEFNFEELSALERYACTIDSFSSPTKVFSFSYLKLRPEENSNLKESARSNKEDNLSKLLTNNLNTINNMNINLNKCIVNVSNYTNESKVNFKENQSQSYNQGFHNYSSSTHNQNTISKPPVLNEYSNMANYTLGNQTIDNNLNIEELQDQQTIKTKSRVIIQNKDSFGGKAITGTLESNKLKEPFPYNIDKESTNINLNNFNRASLVKNMTPQGNKTISRHPDFSDFSAINNEDQNDKSKILNF